MSFKCVDIQILDKSLFLNFRSFCIYGDFVSDLLSEVRRIVGSKPVKLITGIVDLEWESEHLNRLSLTVI